MDPLSFVIYTLILVVLLPMIFYGYRSLRRRQLARRPFPRAWSEILERNVPMYIRLDDKLRTRLQELIHIFLAEKHFVGCQGLVITDEVKVTIAAQACMLLMGNEKKVYPGLDTIVVYPEAFMVRHEEVGAAGEIIEKEDVNLGESWSSGQIVLSWEDALHGGMNTTDGFNVVLHEFAHQLDDEDGQTDGAPLLDKFSDYETWASVFNREFSALQKRRGISVIDRYGAQDPAEFFAVATEAFYERPWQLQRKHAELYEELKAFYKVDPTEWKPRKSPTSTR